MRGWPWLLWFVPFSAAAVSDPVGTSSTAAPATVGAKTTAMLLADLRSDDDSDRLYAARALRAQMKRALRVEARGASGTIAADEARSVLFELEARVPDACRAGMVEHPNVVAACADMIAWLEVDDAEPLLRAALAAETRKGVRRRIERALASVAAP